MGEREDLTQQISGDVTDMMGAHGVVDPCEPDFRLLRVKSYTAEQDELAGDIDPGELGRTSRGASALDSEQWLSVGESLKDGKNEYNDWELSSSTEGRYRAWKKVGGKIFQILEKGEREATLSSLRRLRDRVVAAKEHLDNN